MGTQFSDFNCTYEVLKSESDDNVARFTGIASTSDLDQQHDIIEAGAFDPIPMKMGPDGKSIPDVMLLRDHDRSEVVGGWRSFRTEGRQLKVEGELVLDVAKGRETHSLMKRGYISGLSVGFAIKNMKDIDWDEKTGKRTIKKALLRECSIVAFPANTRARVLNVKSLLEEFDLDGSDSALLERLEKIEKRLIEAWKRKDEDKQAKPPDPKENESQKDYMSRCLDTVGADNGGMAACSKRWKEHNKESLIKGIDGFTPLNEATVESDLRGLLSKVKGYRHV